MFDPVDRQTEQLLYKTDYPVRFRWRGGEVELSCSDARLFGLKKKWSRIVHGRDRWHNNDEVIAIYRDKARKDLIELGLAETDIRDMAQTGHVEVSLDFVREALGYAARTFPWEFVMSAATRKFRKGDDFVVTRHIERGGNGRAHAALDNILFVQSDPGELKKFYSFETERQSIKSIFDETDENGNGACVITKDPTSSDLVAEIQERHPSIVHLSGIDTYEARQLIDLDSHTGQIDDGFVLSDDNGDATPVNYIEWARMFEALGENAPVLVAFNSYYSGARLAIMSVAGGAQFAIGFQDTIEDSIAEDFFTSFYFALNAEGCIDILHAFFAALNHIKRNNDNLLGVGFVFVSATSVSEYESIKSLRSEAPEALFEHKPRLDQDDTLNIKDVLRLDVKVASEINYAMLHNGRSIFERFKFKTSKYGLIQNVDVRVRLQTGGVPFEYRSSFDIDKPTEIHDFIQIPLTWDFARSLQETVIATVLVEVTHGASTIYKRTHQVRLHPLNEWKDNLRDGGWLPSFVLPRDPAVEDILALAKRNLIVLTSDYDARFDGYQSGDPKYVDLQVEAIWAALSFDLKISYIEPPPSYADMSQRLRTPSEILRTKQGTCIDLGLLLAACIEYIGIYPVIFLTKGHSFPGYWRDWHAHRAFTIEGGPKEYTSEATSTSFHESQTDAKGKAQELAPISSRKLYPFEYSEALFYADIESAVGQGDIAPIETTRITDNAGILAAEREGLSNLRPRAEFDAMLDIHTARRNRVTPLPIRATTS